MENPISDGYVEASIRPRNTDCFALKYSVADGPVENTVSNDPSSSGCVNASILLEPSEYFFDDDFAVPFDANLRDLSSLPQQILNENSDEGVSSSGAMNRDISVPLQSRSDSCLFAQPCSGDCGHCKSSAVSAGVHSFPLSQSASCFPDSTSAPGGTECVARIYRSLSADFSLALRDINGFDKLLKNRETFFEPQQPPMNSALSETASWMQTVLEDSCCPRLRELLKHTAEALDYRIAWGEIQIGANNGNFTPAAALSKEFGKIQRSTSHGNIFTAASLTGMRRALANLKIVSPKTYRSVGVSTERSCSDSSLPDTTTSKTTTTWAQIRSSRESLNIRKTVSCRDATIVPSPSKCIKSNVPESVVSWRAVKGIAGSELTTWGQLRRIASLETRMNKGQSNLHASLLPSEVDINFGPVSQKAIHRYSGTLLEIFMRARAQELISSSCPSACTDATTEGTPLFIKRSGFIPRGANSPLQTNILMFHDKETEHASSAVKISNEPIHGMGVPSPKVSQLPLVPLRKSSVSSPRRLLYVNSSGETCFASRLNPGLPDSNLLTMSADPQSECMSRLRDSFFSQLKNPLTAIIYPGLGKLAIPKPSRIESKTFLSQTLPDLSLIGKAAAQEAKSGTPMTRIPTLSHQSHRSVSAAPVSWRTAGVVVNGRGNPNNGRTTQLEAIGKEVNGVRSANLIDVPMKKSQIGVVDRSISEPDAIGFQYEQPQVLTAFSLTKVHSMRPVPGHSLCCNRPRSQSSYCKKSVSFNGLGHWLPGDIPRCLFDHNCFGSPNPKVIPKNWGLYGQNPPPLAVFQPSNDDTNEVSSTTRASDVDVRYHAMVMDLIRAVQETIAYFCQSVLSPATPNGRSITESFLFDSVPPKSPRHHHHHRCYSSLAARGCSGQSSLIAVVNPLMVLISDGLLPPQARVIFASKPKSRIWALVEDSCRPSSCLGKIEHHILNEALNRVKSITGAISEELRFRAFVCACLNQRALLLWLNSLVGNEALTKRYYCDGAFIRQCQSTLQGLYADLTTHLEQLLNYPFNFDLVAEVKRPIGQAMSAAAPLHAFKLNARMADRPNENLKVKESRKSLGRASSTPACITKASPKSVSNRVHPVSKTVHTKMVCPRVHPTSRRAPFISGNQNPTEADSPSAVDSLRRIPFTSPSASAMCGRLRTAFSTFRRSTDLASPVRFTGCSVVPH